jgi:hypothetical protein
VGVIGAKVGHLVGRPDVHVASRPPPLAEPHLIPRIPYLWVFNDTCAKGLNRSERKLGLSV